MQLLQLKQGERFPLDKDITIIGYGLIENNKLTGLDVEQYFLTEIDKYRLALIDLVSRNSDIRMCSLPISLRVENDELITDVISEVPFIALTFPQNSVPGLFLSKPFSVKQGTNLIWKSSTYSSFFNDYRLVIYYNDVKVQNKLTILEALYYTKRLSELDSNRVITGVLRFDYSSVLVNNIRLMPTILFDTTNVRIVYGFDSKVSITRGSNYRELLTDNEYINLYFTGYYLYADIDMFSVSYKSGIITDINMTFGNKLPLDISISNDREITYDALISPTTIVEFIPEVREWKK